MGFVKIKSNHKKYKQDITEEFYGKEKNRKYKVDRNERASYLEGARNPLNVPLDVWMGESIVTIMGKEQICIENFKSIIEYTGDSLCIQGKHRKIRIIGKRLNIDYCTDIEIHISGCIQSVSYL